MSLSVSIVVFNPDVTELRKTLEHLCLSVRYAGLEQVPCYLIDNSSKSCFLPSAHGLFPFSSELDIKILHPGKNLGYGRGNNVVLDKITSQYHVVMNPDIYVSSEAISFAIQYMDAHSEVGILCPAIYGENGDRHYVHRKHPTFLDMLLRGFFQEKMRKLFSRRMADFELRHLNWEQEQVIPSPSGCFMFFRASVFKEISGFDERYFLYYEDSDIGRKAWRVSQVRYVPQVKVIHLWARESHKRFKIKLSAILSGIKYLLKWNLFER